MEDINIYNYYHKNRMRLSNLVKTKYDDDSDY